MRHERDGGARTVAQHEVVEGDRAEPLPAGAATLENAVDPREERPERHVPEARGDDRHRREPDGPQQGREHDGRGQPAPPRSPLGATARAEHLLLEVVDVVVVELVVDPPSPRHGGWSIGMRPLRTEVGFRGTARVSGADVA